MWCMAEPPRDKIPPPLNIFESNESTARPFILLVEDSPADVFLIRQAFQVHDVSANLQCAADGDEAIRIIDQLDAANGTCPQLILLDLNLPGRTGVDVLRHLRQSSRCRRTPVIIVTSSNAQADHSITEELGADDYFQKPLKLDQFLEIGRVVKDFLSRL